MVQRQRSIVLVFLGLVAVLVMTAGVMRAFERGGSDFSVFYEAWRLVLAGRGDRIYFESPDRFLYSPGFAWVLSPFALLSKPISLFLWSFLKLVFLVLVSWDWIPRLKEGVSRTSRAILLAGSIIFIARPLLIDLEYGQVNLFVMSACIWALSGHINSACEPFRNAVRWFVLSFLAFVKLFPLPLLMLPLFSQVPKKKLWYEVIAIVLGFFFAILFPALFIGINGVVGQLHDWGLALMSKGLPLESHNQSFIALLFHSFSGIPTYVISESAPILFGKEVFSIAQIHQISAAWSLVTMGLLIGWVLTGGKKKGGEWLAIAIGLLIIPSHLVWKPYFVMTFPLAVVLIDRVLDRKNLLGGVLLFLLFLFFNFTSFDFVGHRLGAHFEAISILLLVHLTMLGFVRLGVHKSELRSQ